MQPTHLSIPELMQELHEKEMQRIAFRRLITGVALTVFGCTALGIDLYAAARIILRLP